MVGVVVKVGVAVRRKIMQLSQLRVGFHKKVIHMRRLEYLLNLPEFEQAYISSTEQERVDIGKAVHRKSLTFVRAWFNKKNKTMAKLREQGFSLKIKYVTRLSKKELENAIQERLGQDTGNMGGDGAVAENVWDSEAQATGG